MSEPAETTITFDILWPPAEGDLVLCFVGDRVEQFVAPWPGRYQIEVDLGGGETYVWALDPPPHEGAG